MIYQNQIKAKLKKMKIDVDEYLIEPNERNSFMIDDEINNFLKNDEGQNIKADIELLKSMGFDKKMINKIIFRIIMI